uniref:Uncharacterized protein n=1 Tax=Physcomitrium patens TaxID=3218 RepID=A0A7I4DPL2_PHYPA
MESGNRTTLARIRDRHWIARWLL